MCLKIFLKLQSLSDTAWLKDVPSFGVSNDGKSVAVRDRNGNVSLYCGGSYCARAERITGAEPFRLDNNSYNNTMRVSNVSNNR